MVWIRHESRSTAADIHCHVPCSKTNKSNARKGKDARTVGRTDVSSIERSQSTRRPLPVALVTMFAILILQCKMWASKYARSWAFPKSYFWRSRRRDMMRKCLPSMASRTETTSSCDGCIFQREIQLIINFNLDIHAPVTKRARVAWPKSHHARTHHIARCSDRKEQDSVCTSIELRICMFSIWPNKVILRIVLTG